MHSTQSAEPAQRDVLGTSSARSEISNTSNSLIRQIKSSLTNTLEGTKPKSSIAVLDGVRAIAILSVVLYHISIDSSINNISWLDRHIVAFIYSGSAGVTLFLILSGFLLFLPYIKSLLFENAWPSTWMFYVRRMLRILPAYYLSLFLIIMLEQPQYLQPDHWKQLLLFLTFFMDSAHSTFYQINSPFWTLAVEWQFYMILPWLALAMRPIVQRGSLTRRVWMLVLCLTVMIIWGCTTRYYGAYVLAHPTQDFGIPPSILKVAVALLYGTNGFDAIHGKFLEDFAIGMLAALCYTVAQNSAPESRWNTILKRLSPWLLISSILIYAVMALWNAGLLVPLGNDSFSVFLYGDAWIIFHEFGLAIGCGCFALSILFGSSMLKRIFEWSPLRWIGIISFSLYIWHYPILQHFKDAMAPFVQNWSILQIFCLNLVWVMIVATLFSYLNFILVEKPFMRISDNLRKNKDTKAQVLTSKSPSPTLKEPEQHIISVALNEA